MIWRGAIVEALELCVCRLNLSSQEKLLFKSHMNMGFYQLSHLQDCRELNELSKFLSSLPKAGDISNQNFFSRKFMISFVVN